jgi:hypothetical protein
MAGAVTLAAAPSPRSAPRNSPGSAKQPLASPAAPNQAPPSPAGQNGAPGKPQQKQGLASPAAPNQALPGPAGQNAAPGKPQKQGRQPRGAVAAAAPSPAPGAPTAAAPGPAAAQPARGNREPPRGNQRGNGQDERTLEVPPDPAWTALGQSLAEKAVKHGRVYALMMISPENRARLLEATRGIKGVTVKTEGEGHFRRVAFVPEKIAAITKKPVMPDYDDEDE